VAKSDYLDFPMPRPFSETGSRRTNDGPQPNAPTGALIGSARGALLPHRL